MIFRLSQKTNINGWRKQITIDFENKTIKAGAFQFHSGDVENLTATQYKQVITYFLNNDFKMLED